MPLLGQEKSCSQLAWITWPPTLSCLLVCASFSHPFSVSSLDFAVANNCPVEALMENTPVFLPGKSHGQRGAWLALVHGVTESDRTERLKNNKGPQQALSGTDECHSLSSPSLPLPPPGFVITPNPYAAPVAVKPWPFVSTWSPYSASCVSCID